MLCFYVRVRVYLFDRCIQGKFIGFLFRFTEDNSSAVAAAVHLDHVPDHSSTLGPVARYGQVLRKHDRRAHEFKWQIFNYESSQVQ